MNRNGIIYTVVFTFVTAFFFVFFLSLANNATISLVEENKIVSIQKSVLRSIGKLPAEDSQVSAAYSAEFDTVPEPGDVIATTLDGEEIVIRYFSGSGLWGTITGVLALDSGLNRIIGLDIISHNETPGLGGRIDEEWFKNQFAGEKIGDKGITVVKGTGSSDDNPDNSAVDGVTGASLTSKSMETIVNREIASQRTEGGSR